MPFVQGYLRIRGRGHPDNELPGGSGGEIDNSLPGDQPGIDNELPPAPPGVFPPPTIANPIVPIPPGTSVPPGVIWPSPGRPNRPDNSLPGSGNRPDQGLPSAPARPDQGLPGGGGGRPSNPIASHTYWMLCYTPNHGWKYVSVDPSLDVDAGLPAPPPNLPTPHK